MFAKQKKTERCRLYYLHTLPLVCCAMRHFRPRRQRRRGSAVIDIPGRCARSFGAAVQSMMMLISGRRKRRLRSFCSLGLVSRPCAQTRRATVHPNFVLLTLFFIRYFRARLIQTRLYLGLWHDEGMSRRRPRGKSPSKKVTLNPKP